MTTIVHSDQRPSIPQTVSNVAVLVRRNLRRIARLPQLLLFATVQPVMFLLLFNYVFGGSIGQSLPPAAGGQYINWLIPGLLVQVAVFGASSTAIGLSDDLKKGVIDRFRSLPVARSAVLAGRTIADLVRNAFVISLMLGVGLLIGFEWQTSFAETALAFLLAVAFAFAFSWVMAAIGLAVKDPETAQTASFLPLFPLVFASSVFVPTDTMPGWLQAFADNQPITVVANTVRSLMIPEEAVAFLDLDQGALIGQSIAWIAGIIVVFGYLSVRQYKKSVG